MRRQLGDVQDRAARWRRALASLLALASIFRFAAVQAEPAQSLCAPAAHGFIAVHTPTGATAAELAWRDVVEHVRSELLLRQVGVCTDSGHGPALADLTFESSAADGVRIRLFSINPRVPLAERSLELATLPADARLLAIAVATDELLFANWAELERRAAEPPASPVPTTSGATKSATVAESRFELGPGFVYEAFSGGRALLGFDVRAGVRLQRRLTLTARLGFREALPERAPHGSVHGQALLGGLGLRLGLVQGSRFELGLHGHADALRVALNAYPNASATAYERAEVAVVLGAGPAATLALSRSLRLALAASAGGAVRPVYVTDSGARVESISGLALSLAGGIFVVF